MKAIWLLACKDWRLLLRDRGALFSMLFFPLLYASFFGLIFSGGGSGDRAISLVLVDEDSSKASRAFVADLQAHKSLRISEAGLEEARDLVRLGKRQAWLRLPPGYGEAGDRLFFGDPPRAELGVDPSRKAEAGMLEGLLQMIAAQRFNQVFSGGEDSRQILAKTRDWLREDNGGQVPSFLRHLDQFYGTLDSLYESQEEQGLSAEADSLQATESGFGGFQPIVLERQEVVVRRQGPTSSFAVSFPQGIVWALIGCAASFGLSLISERRKGTLDRLRLAAVRERDLLASRTLACMGVMLGVCLLLFGFAVLVFGLRPSSWPLLFTASLASSWCFTGIMLSFSAFGKSEQAASGIGWGLLSLLAMLGGGMIPLIFMPGWMRSLSMISPVRWVVVSLEGALWRNFAPGEMLPALLVLFGSGILFFLLGLYTSRRSA